MFFKLGVLKKSAKKVAGATLLKRDSSTDVFWEYCKVFKNNFFIEHLGQLLLSLL